MACILLNDVEMQTITGDKMILNKGTAFTPWNQFYEQGTGWFMLKTDSNVYLVPREALVGNVEATGYPRVNNTVKWFLDQL